MPECLEAHVQQELRDTQDVRGPASPKPFGLTLATVLDVGCDDDAENFTDFTVSFTALAGRILERALHRSIFERQCQSFFNPGRVQGISGPFSCPVDVKCPSPPKPTAK